MTLCAFFQLLLPPFIFFPSFLSLSVALLCALFVFLSIFLALAIPSPTHFCHRRSGGSSLISEAAKNRERQTERGRERLCSFNGEEKQKCLRFHRPFSKLESCLPLFEQWYQRLNLSRRSDTHPVERCFHLSYYTCGLWICQSGNNR